MATQTKQTKRVKVENLMVFALSGTCTVRYMGGRISQVEIALGGVQPPLVMHLRDAGGVILTYADGRPVRTTAAVAEVAKGVGGAVELAREIGRYIALSFGVDPESAEALTR